MKDSDHFSRHGRELGVDIWYPRVEGEPNAVVVGLIDVRAADGIRISYDFERDGWKIEQAQVFSWELLGEDCDPQWKEVAFVQAWASYAHHPILGDDCHCAQCEARRAEP